MKTEGDTLVPSECFGLCQLDTSVELAYLDLEQQQELDLFFF